MMLELHTEPLSCARFSGNFQANGARTEHPRQLLDDMRIPYARFWLPAEYLKCFTSPSCCGCICSQDGLLRGSNQIGSESTTAGLPRLASQSHQTAFCMRRSQYQLSFGCKKSSRPLSLTLLDGSRALHAIVPNLLYHFQSGQAPSSLPGPPRHACLDALPHHYATQGPV